MLRQAAGWCCWAVGLELLSCRPQAQAIPACKHKFQGGKKGCNELKSIVPQQYVPNKASSNGFVGYCTLSASQTGNDMALT